VGEKEGEKKEKGKRKKEMASVFLFLPPRPNSSSRLNRTNLTFASNTSVEAPIPTTNGFLHCCLPPPRPYQGKVPSFISFVEILMLHALINFVCDVFF